MTFEIVHTHNSGKRIWWLVEHVPAHMPTNGFFHDGARRGPFRDQAEANDCYRSLVPHIPYGY